jgi:hypothetical protein
MKRKVPFRWWIILIMAAVVTGLACNLSGETEQQPTPTDEMPLIDAAATAESAAAVTDEPVDVEPTATDADPAPTATLPQEAEEPTPTAEPTEEPTSIFEPTVTISETVEPVTALPGLIAPGQETTGSLESGGAQFFTFQGTKFEPVLAFVESDDNLNVAVSAYLGNIDSEADLSQLEPLNESDSSPTGWPEAMVITPNEEGAYTVVIQPGGTTAGDFTLYMFNGTTPAPNARFINDSLAAGETKEYEATSNGGRPLVVFADQIGQSDLVIKILFASGNVAGEANFGGSNSAETLYVLPEGTTTYTVTVSTLNGEAAVYDLVIVTLD